MQKPSSPEMVYHEKLVRDLIPEIVKQSGAIPYWRQIQSLVEYRSLLGDKLQEEYTELLTATSRDETVQELADVSEVLHSYMAKDDYPEHLLDHIRKKRIAYSALPERLSKDEAEESFTKLHERLARSPSSSERREILADLLHCTYAIGEAISVNAVEIEEARITKRKKRGAFLAGIFLIKTVERDPLNISD